MNTSTQRIISALYITLVVAGAPALLYAFTP